jgi:hypothetical protein
VGLGVAQSSEEEGGRRPAPTLTAQSGPRENDGRRMTSKAPVSIAARERLRNHQAAAAKAVGAHSAALARLEAVTSRRAEVLTAQDGLVAAANAEVAAAVVTAARAMGADVAATLLDVSKAEVRRVMKAAQLAGI